ncbi:hypothetical protein SGPA1_30521 [Streptomyces misionensis JCM 4497]
MRHSHLQYQWPCDRPKTPLGPSAWDHGDYVSIRPEA